MSYENEDIEQSYAGRQANIPRASTFRILPNSEWKKYESIMERYTRNASSDDKEEKNPFLKKLAFIYDKIIGMVKTGY